jgi:MFS family permease
LNDPSQKSSLLAPLGIPAFRAIWSANLVSNLGTLVQSVAAAWLMTGLTTSTTLVGLVQTAATLPVFLVGLLAGALADIVDRKHLLFWSQAWMLLFATLLGLTTLFGHVTPWLLLGFTFAIGLGAAISLPAWQATVQDLVPKPWVPAAVSLNAIAFNVARAFGPALGGFLVATAGAAAAFLANAASFVAVLLAVAFWKPAPAPALKLTEDILGAIRAGFRYLLHAPRLQAPIARAAIYNLCAGAVWALLPLMARDVFRTDATGYGLLLGAFGCGSILSALLVPRLRARFQLDRILFAGVLVCATAYAGLSFTTNVAAAAGLLFLAGIAWVGVFINFNVAVQTAVPAWVRGRALSFYLLTFQGILALDGALWGWLAGVVGTPQCFAIASGGLVIGLIGIRFFPLTVNDDLDHTRPTDWPYAHDHLPTEIDDGPVLVTVEFFIAPENVPAFRDLMHQLREQRLRDGARRWRLYHDMEDPERFVELFRLDSWADHLLQVERLTVDDLRVRSAVFALHKGPEKPRARHYLGVAE